MILLQIKVRMMSSWSLVQFQLPILLPDSSADTVKRVLAEYMTKVTKSDNNSSNKRNTVNNNVTEDKDGIRIYLFNPELYLQYSSNLLHFRASKTKQDPRKSSMSRQGSDQPSSSRKNSEAHSKQAVESLEHLLRARLPVIYNERNSR